MIRILVGTLLEVGKGIRTPENVTDVLKSGDRATSEITPIKQSGGVMIAMLGGFIYTVIYCALFFMVGYKLGAVQFLLAVAAINLILSVLIYLWLKKKGTAVFSAL